MKNLFYVFATIFISILFGQQGEITGVVHEKSSNLPLPGVQVYIPKLNMGTATDSTGRFKLVVPMGTHEIVFKLIGYKEEKRTVTVETNKKLNLQIEMIETSTLLNEVVISAGKFEQKMSEVTVSIDVIKPDFIQSNATTSLEAALQKVPGVAIMDDQASIRGGSGYSYGAGSRVLFLVDDIPLITGATGEIRWEFLPIENVQQIEVLKGASSALYGSSALNGVIHYRTFITPIQPFTQITTQYGIYGNPKRKTIQWWEGFNPTFAGIRFFHGQTIKNFSFNLSGQLFSDAGYRENDNEQRGIISGYVRYKFPKSNGLSIAMRINAMRREGNKFLLWHDGDSGVYRKNENFQQVIKNEIFDVSPALDYWKNSTTHHAVKFKLYSIRNYNNTQQNNYDDLYYGEYLFQKKLQENSLTWSNGLVATYNISQADIFGNKNHFGKSLALYTQADKRIGRFNISAGGRLEGYQIDDDAAIYQPVLRTGVNYMLVENTFLRASFGQGYRYPTIAERYTATSTGNIRIFPNPDLQPEKGYSAEVGFKHGFRLNTWQGYLDIAGFFMRYRDMIEFRFGYFNPDTVTLVAYPPSDPNYFLNWLGFKAFNVEKAQVSGFEINFSNEGKIFNLPAQFTVGYTYTYPLDLSDEVDTLKSSSRKKILKYRFFHDLKVDGEVGYKKAFIGANVEFQSKIINIDRVFEDTIRYPNGAPILIPPSNEPALMLPGLKEYREKHNGFVVLDLRFKYNFSEKVSFLFNIKNALNAEYMIRPGDVQPPRTFVFQLMVRV